MNEKRLTLNKSKCVNLNVGNLDCSCHEKMKVKDTRMEKTESEIYLGNVMHSSGDLSYTVDQRITKGQGVIAEIAAF